MENEPLQKVQRGSWISSITIFLLAVFLGSPVGGFFLGAGYGLIELYAAFIDKGTIPSANLDDAFGTPFGFAALSYLFGLFAAVPSGLICAVIFRRAARLSLSMTLLIVAVCSVAASVLLAFGDDWKFDLGLLSFAVQYIAMSLLSAFLLHLVFRKLLKLDGVRESSNMPIADHDQ